MQILIAGGAGFIGRHLSQRLLDEGHSVTCIDNLLTGSLGATDALARCERFRFIKHDICEPLPPALPGFDEIYNLACPASPAHYQADAIATMRTCSDGTRNLLERARADGARMFHASTSEIYGDPIEHPQREDYTGNVHTIGPRACYDEGKRYAESLVHAYADQHGVDAKLGRIFNTYGPGMQINDGRLISNVVVQALTGDPVTIFGDGSQTRSLCFVDDTVEAIIRLTRSDLGADTPVNIGNPDEMTVADIVGAVLMATGSRSPVEYLPRPLHDPVRRQPDIARADALLGWQPRVPLAEGLSRTIAHFRETLGLEVRLAAGA